jgi:hypothetical protein
MSGAVYKHSLLVTLEGRRRMFCKFCYSIFTVFFFDGRCAPEAKRLKQQKMLSFPQSKQINK